MNVRLAMYITLSAVALVAIAQILIWKLIVRREHAVLDGSELSTGEGEPVLAGI